MLNNWRVFPVSVKSDAELLIAAKAGDKEACSLLLAKHRPRLLRFIRTKVKSSHEAEDLTQQTLLAAYTHLNTFRGDSSFYTWLHTIIVRKLYKRPSNSLKTEEILIDTDTPEKQIELRQEIDVVNTIISKLPELERKVAIGTLYENKSHKQLADELGYTRGYVKKVAHKAKQTIRKEYDERG